MGRAPVRLQRLMTRISGGGAREAGGGGGGTAGAAGRALHGRRIVVTRAREQAADLVRALETLGAETIVAPVIRIQPLENLASLRAALTGLSAYRWVVFTSQNAVQIVLDRLVSWGLRPRVFAATSIAAIGSATAESLRKRGLVPALVPDEFVAEALVDALVHESGGSLAGARVLVPSAEDARETLTEGLQRHGAAVETIPVYRTVPAHGDFDDLISEIIDRRIDAVTFTSSSSVRSFVQLVGSETATSGRFVTATIGPITAGTARELGLRDVIEAAPHTVPGLVASLVTRFA